MAPVLLQDISRWDRRKSFKLCCPVSMDQGCAIPCALGTVAVAGSGPGQAGLSELTPEEGEGGYGRCWWCVEEGRVRRWCWTPG